VAFCHPRNPVVTPLQSTATFTQQIHISCDSTTPLCLLNQVAGAVYELRFDQVVIIKFICVIETCSSSKTPTRRLLMVKRKFYKSATLLPIMRLSTSVEVGLAFFSSRHCGGPLFHSAARRHGTPICRHFSFLLGGVWGCRMWVKE
jgi:hypothetical protein